VWKGCEKGEGYDIFFAEEKNDSKKIKYCATAK